MKRRIKILALILLLVQFSNQLTAQCNSNTSICYQGLAGPFLFNQSTPGPPTDFANPTMCSTGLFGNPNGFGFILLYITTSGPLNLLVDGNANTGFIDVVVYNIPSGMAPCNAVMNQANEIGCNYATSAVGCTQFGNDFGCASSLPAPFVTAGQVIMIIVHDYSSSSNSFTLNLGPSGAQTGPPNATINPSGPFCVSGPTQQLTAVNMGGTWTGPGVSPTGVFNPATAGIGTHTITYNIGVAPCNSSSTTTVTVTSATVTPPANVSVCQGAGTTLTASGATTYTWSPATGLSSTTGATVTASPATTTTYTVTGTTGGCSSSGNVTVTVTPPPTITVNSPTICSGASATLTANGGTSYTWSPPTGLSATTGATVTATPAATTTYTVTGSNGGCSGTANATVTVNPQPVISVNSPTICSGGSTTLTASGATSYTWSPATGLSSTTGATVTANPTVTTTYTVTGTTAGCSGSATSTVTIGPNPVITVNNPTICSGASATLTASGATTYTWSPPTGLSATTGATVTANPAVTTTYTVTGMIGGCTGSATSTVTIGPSPVITVNSGTICNGASLVLNASGGTTYTWTPATGLSATTGASVTASPTTTITYTVTGTTGGCSGTANATVTVNPTPTVTVNSATICNGSSATLTANGAASYSWSPATGLSATTGTTITASPAATTTYTITGTTAAGCSSNTTATVTVNPIPVVTAAPATICNGTTTPLTATGATTYAWSPATGLSATTGTTVNANPAATTTYTITGTSLGCSGTGTVTVTVNPVPSVAQVANETWCPNTAVPAEVFTSAPAGATFSWANSNTTTGIGQATGSGSLPAFTSANSGSTANVSDISVTPTLNGCTGAAMNYTITIDPTPVINPVADVTHCAGETFASIPLSSVPASTISWSNNNSGIGLGTSGSNAVPSFTAANSGTSDISGTVTLNGTLNGCPAVPVTFDLTVLAVPVMSPVTSATFCNGDAVPGSSLNSNVPGTNYTWVNSNPNIGAPASGTNDLQPFTATNPGTTAISGNFTVTPWSGTCAGQPQAFAITISPTPAVQPMNNITECAGQMIPSMTPSGNVAQSSFAWTNSNTSIGLAANGTTSTTPFAAVNSSTMPVTSTVTVVPTAAGCTGAPETMTITINPMPIAAASNTGPYCLMDDASFAAQSFPGASYSWTGPSAFSSTAQNPSVNDVTAANEGTYNLTVTANGCTSTSSTVMTITPGIPVTIAPAGPFCADNGPVQMSVNDYGGTWSGNGVSASGMFDPSQAGAGDILVVYTPQPGCMVTNSSVVTVNMMPVIQFTGDDLSGCGPHTVEFTDMTVPANGDLIWDFGDGETATDNGTVEHTYESAGIYTVTLTSATEGCASTASMTNYIEVLQPAMASFDVLSSSATTTTDPTFNFENASLNADEYTWTFGDESAGSNDENPSHTYPETAGSYTVMLVANNEGDCPDTVRRTVSIAEELIFFVPNAFTPDGDEYNNTFSPVFHSGYDPYSYTLYIFDRWGEVLFESHDTAAGWDGTYMGQLAQEGVYTWKIDFKLSGNDKRVEYIGSTSLLR